MDELYLPSKKSLFMKRASFALLVDPYRMNTDTFENFFQHWNALKEAGAKKVQIIILDDNPHSPALNAKFVQQLVLATNIPLHQFTFASTFLFERKALIPTAQKAYDTFEQYYEKNSYNYKGIVDRWMKREKITVAAKQLAAKDLIFRRCMIHWFLINHLNFTATVSLEGKLPTYLSYIEMHPHIGQSRMPHFVLNNEGKLALSVQRELPDVQKETPEPLTITELDEEDSAQVFHVDLSDEDDSSEEEKVEQVSRALDYLAATRNPARAYRVRFCLRQAEEVVFHYDSQENVEQNTPPKLVH